MRLHIQNVQNKKNFTEGNVKNIDYADVIKRQEKLQPRTQGPLSKLTISCERAQITTAHIISACAAIKLAIQT